MEGRVKSRISEKTYITDLENLEEEDADETSELYMIPISGHKIMVAPGKTIMADGIAHCYVYVIKNEKVLCKLGVYEKKTETMPLFFDLSTFPEGSFCLFEEFEKNPTKLLDFEMIETEAEAESAVETKGQNVFDFLIDEFAKIPNKKERLKSAYKALFKIYEPMKGGEKDKQYKKIKPIIKAISEAGKETDPTDDFLQRFKKEVSNVTEEIPGSFFVMILLALQHVFLIDFSFDTENEDLKMMKTDWPITNASTVVEVNVNTYGIVDKEGTEPEAVFEPEEPEEPEPEEPLSKVTSPKSKSRPTSVSEPLAEASIPKSKVKSVSEPLTEASKPKSKPMPKSVSEPLAEASIPKSKVKSVSEAEESLAQLSKPKSRPTTKTLSEVEEPLSQLSKTKPSAIFKPESMSVTEPVKVKKSTMPKKSETSEKASTETPAKEKYVPAQAELSKGQTYESPLSQSTIQDIIARTKSHKSTAKLMKDYQAGIMPSTPEEEKRLRDSLVSMVASKMSKKGSVAAASELAASVSKLKESKANAKESVKANVPVTLKQSRSIPKVKTQSKE